MKGKAQWPTWSVVRILPEAREHHRTTGEKDDELVADNAGLGQLLVEPSTIERSGIAAVVAGVTGGRLHDLRRAFDDAATAAEATDVSLSHLYRLLALAFEAPLRPERAQQPFAPLITYETGERSLVPGDFSPEHLDLLRKAINRSSHPAFRARLLDILWTGKHPPKSDLPRHAEAAVEAYLADARLKQTSGEGWQLAPKSLERALRLSLFVDRRGEGSHVTTRAVVAELSAAFEATRRLAAFMHTQALLREFGIGQSGDNAEACERCAVAAEAEGDTIIAEGLWKHATAFWRQATDDTRMEEAIRQAAELAVRQAEARAADSSGIAASFLEGAIKCLRQLPAAKRSEREAELRKRLAEQQARSLGELKEVSTSFDGRETWERAQHAVSGRKLFDALRALVLHARIEQVDKIRTQVEQDAGTFAFMHLVPLVVTGDGGKTIKHVSSMRSADSAEREAAARFHMVRRANMSQDMIGAIYVEPARRVIAAEHGVSTLDLLPFTARSGLVPPRREWQWAKALAAGFDGDFTTATHILLPQLEHALLALVRQHGTTAVSIDKLGQQEDWNLNNLLLREEGRAAVEAILGPDIVFDLAALLVDRNGVNLRNAVAHGGIDDGGLEGGFSRYFFWCCLRLCLIPLIAYAQQNDMEDAPQTGVVL